MPNLILKVLAHKTNLFVIGTITQHYLSRALEHVSYVS